MTPHEHFDDEGDVGYIDTMFGGEDGNFERRISRSSLKWFQEETRRNSVDNLLIRNDGKLSDDYILKRQSINKPATLKTIPLLADLTTQITDIDGWVLTQLFLSGFAKLSSKIDELNKINVFPIADGDTGANMKVCLKLPTRNLLLHPSDNALTVASNLAADVLLNGQGNSGTILSHWFVSFAEEVTAIGKDTLSVQEFANCLVKTGAKMNEAVPNPVEGTLLSVSRDACHLPGPFANLKELLDAWNQKAKTELAKTPDQLIVDGVKVLEKAGVVDSGAAGFAYFVEGMFLASEGKLPEASDPALFQTAKPTSEESMEAAVHDHNVCDSAFQYCTEAVVLLKEGATKSDILGCVTAELGDSVACVQAPSKEGGHMCKLHIHTNKPQEVFDRVREYSREPDLKKEKVEDMYEMRDETHVSEAVDLSEAKFSIAGLCSIVLPPQERSDDLVTFPIFVVPSTTQEPIDVRYATSTDTVAALNGQRHTSTAIRYTAAASNPMQIKIELLAALSRGKPVLVFIMSKDKRVSSFGRNVAKAIELLEPQQQSLIKVLVHGWFGHEQVLLREAIACAQQGRTIEEAYETCKDLADRNMIFHSFLSCNGMRKLAGMRPELFPKDFTVADGEYFSLGVPPEVREGEPWSDMKRASTVFQVLNKAPSLSELLDTQVQHIKESLQHGQAIASLMIVCVGRPDYGKAFSEKIQAAGIPLVGKPTIYGCSYVSVANGSWGDISVVYKIVTI